MANEIEVSARLKVENLNAAGYEAKDDWEEVELKFTQTGYRVYQSYQAAGASQQQLTTGYIDITSGRVWYMMKNVEDISGIGRVRVRPGSGGTDLIDLGPQEVAIGVFAQNSSPFIIEPGGGTANLKYMLVEV